MNRRLFQLLVITCLCGLSGAARTFDFNGLEYRIMRVINGGESAAKSGQNLPGVGWEEALPDIFRGAADLLRAIDRSSDKREERRQDEQEARWERERAERERERAELAEEQAQRQREEAERARERTELAEQNEAAAREDARQSREVAEAAKGAAQQAQDMAQEAQGAAQEAKGVAQEAQGAAVEAQQQVQEAHKRVGRQNAFVSLLALLALLALGLALRKPRQQIVRVVGNANELLSRAFKLAPRAGNAPAGAARLALTGFDKRGRPVNILLHDKDLDDLGGFTLGRHHLLVDKTLDDERVSKRHVRFSNAGHGVYIEDLNSSNGTVLNGTQPCPSFKPVKIRPGDTLRLGGMELVVSA